MISAPVGSSLIVSGISIATVSAGPTPGSTPMKVPSVTPRNPQRRLSGVSAMLKPCSNEPKVSAIGAQMPAPPSSGWSQPAGKLTFKNLTKKRKTARPRTRPMAKSRTSLPLPKPRATQSKQRRLGEHEAGGVDQKNLRDQSGAHPDKGARLEGMLAARLRDRPESRCASRPREPRKATTRRAESGRRRSPRSDVRPDARVTAGARTIVKCRSQRRFPGRESPGRESVRRVWLS